jgi:hypothetical protein
VSQAHPRPRCFSTPNRLNMPPISDLQAVGLTAAFATALGRAGISCNVVAGAQHGPPICPGETG